MTAQRRVGDDERRARLVRRHHLSAPAASCEDAADALVGLHSSDAATVVLALRARVDGFRVGDLEAALYERRSLARVLAMRRTMFVVPTGLVPTVHAACTRALAPAERRRTVRLLTEGGVPASGDPAAWLAEVEAATLAALRRRGQATAVELTEDVPALGEQIAFGEGKRWGGTFGVSTRVLFLLATEGRVVRARPRGGWTSTQYRWAVAGDWLGLDVEALDTTPSRADLAARWLRAFGPAPVDDLRWWTGWTKAATRQALAALDVAEVDLDGGVGVVLADDVDPVAPLAPEAVLLPALDPTVMGWQARGFLLGDHRAALFDRNGNAGPTVWWDGRVVGGWAQRDDGEVVVRLLADVGAEAATAVEAEQGSLQAWLADALPGGRVVPRFRTPLERELTT